MDTGALLDQSLTRVAPPRVFSRYVSEVVAPFSELAARVSSAREPLDDWSLRKSGRAQVVEITLGLCWNLERKLADIL